MATWIEQLKQRLATMVGLGASTSTPYEGEDFLVMGVEHGCVIVLESNSCDAILIGHNTVLP